MCLTYFFGIPALIRPATRSGGAACSQVRARTQAALTIDPAPRLGRPEPAGDGIVVRGIECRSTGGFTIGDSHPFFDNNRHPSHLLAAKGSRPALHVWEGRAHHGDAWRQMEPHYL